MTTPAGDIVTAATQTMEVRDERGRSFTIRHVNALDRLRLLKAAGPDLSQNDAWLNMAILTLAVVAMDGVPRIMPSNERQIEAAILEFGDPGLEAIAHALNEGEKALSLFTGPPEGNLLGTSS